MQNLAARQNYLQAEVHTATPQKLQLMLVEAAIKNIHRTKKAWEEERFEAGFESLSLAQDIVAEILSSVDKEGNPELAGKIASIYVFIFRCLAEGGMTHDPKKLDDALRVLNSERETWRLVCEKFGTSLDGDSSARLDLSTDTSSAPVVPKAPAKPSGITTSSFGRPASKPSAPPPDKPAGGMSWDV
ncbi:MAG: flagellar export chaperone FliS [Planctomycetaceae bacterium]|nr:flagellar export chaperone FliS [Planctomycetaceae bacterium]